MLVFFMGKKFAFLDLNHCVLDSCLSYVQEYLTSYAITKLVFLSNLEQVKHFHDAIHQDLVEIYAFLITLSQRIVPHFMDVKDIDRENVHDRSILDLILLRCT